MARISSYPIDSTIQDKDSWIGTDSSNRVTRNFTAEDIANYVVTFTSAAITKLVPYFQIATPGGSDTYTQSNNIVDFDRSGGSGTYEYILPSATAIPYRTI